MLFARRFVTIFVILLSQLCSAADAQTKVPQCAFRNVVAFGASLTQATPSLIPGYAAFADGVQAYDDWFHNHLIPSDRKSPLNRYAMRPYGGSPVRELVKAYSGSWSFNRIKYIGTYVTRNDQGLGSAQIVRLLAGNRASLFKSASMIVGVDAFYWDSIMENCGYGNGAGVEPLIPALISAAKRQGTNLILGTVPFENSYNVKIASDRTGVNGLWYAPDPRCSESINQTLKQFCTVENGCYLVDLKAAVDGLNCGERMPLKDGSTQNLFELRPDGVHLSDKGSTFISELMIDALEQNPPSCAPKN